ncbi:MAG TPA: hypothetical protein VEY06_01085 [Flavisolibacter sp.]|nr:hypothetical protein [Flavisolibacter sp.]
MTERGLDASKIIEIWKRYMPEEGHTVSQKEFVKNMEEKIKDGDFLRDMQGLLRTVASYNVEKAYEFVREELLMRVSD